jgi:GTPase SAR1 family protein
VSDKRVTIARSEWDELKALRVAYRSYRAAILAALDVTSDDAQEVKDHLRAALRDERVMTQRYERPDDAA